MRSLILHAKTTLHERWGGPSRYIRIVVHPNVFHLRRIAATYRMHDEDLGDTVGVFHPALFRERYVDGEWRQTSDPHWAGVMRLAATHLSTDVVVHECMHAALYIYRADVARRVDLGDDCEDAEETFAYIAGDLTAAVNNALHAGNAWGTVEPRSE